MVIAHTFSAVYMCTDYTFLILFFNSDVKFALIVVMICEIEPTEGRGKTARIQCLLWIVHLVELITFVVNWDSTKDGYLVVWWALGLAGRKMYPGFSDCLCRSTRTKNGGNLQPTSMSAPQAVLPAP